MSHPTDQIPCAHCHQLNRRASTHCDFCGLRLSTNVAQSSTPENIPRLPSKAVDTASSSTSVCPHCGAPMPAFLNICPQCKKSKKDTTATAPSQSTAPWKLTVFAIAGICILIVGIYIVGGRANLTGSSPSITSVSPSNSVTAAAVGVPGATKVPTQMPTLKTISVTYNIMGTGKAQVTYGTSNGSANVSTNEEVTLPWSTTVTMIGSPPFSQKNIGPSLFCNLINDPTRHSATTAQLSIDGSVVAQGSVLLNLYLDWSGKVTDFMGPHSDAPPTASEIQARSAEQNHQRENENNEERRRFGEEQDAQRTRDQQDSLAQRRQMEADDQARHNSQ